jgi:alanine racemase
MIDYSISQIAAITEGTLYLPCQFREYMVRGIVTDSRTFFKGENSLFFALPGPRNNGHNYISLLMQRGIKAFVVSDPEYISQEAAFILVPDTIMALQKFAAYNRSLYDYPVIAITGSNGKTIIKEWLYELLSAEYSIVRSPKSYNSQIGVPLSVLLMDDHFDLAILEAGISQPGEMHRLSSIIKPDTGILTNIGDAHQENFRSVQEKTEEKLLLFTSAGKLIFCVDDKETARAVKKFCSQNGIEEISWTLCENSALIRFKAESNEGVTSLSASLKGRHYKFNIPFTDKSSVENCCHCFALATVLQENPEKIIPAFEKLGPVEMRLEIKQGINNSLLINDYYNSDLASLSIALSVLHQQSKAGHLKKQVILSDLQQTGIPLKELYSRVNQLLEQWNIDIITGIGPQISANAGLFSVKRSFYSSTGAFENSLNRADFSESAILIKGARSFAFESISAILQQKAHQTILQIDMSSLVHNLNVFRSLLRPSTRIMVMVKAFSYGSGDVEIAKLLQFHNVDYLAVAVADEGVLLRQSGIRSPIIVMNPESHSFQNMIDHYLEPNVYSFQLLKDFAKCACRSVVEEFPVHIKIDTGMNRLGFKQEAEVSELINELRSYKCLKVKSVFSHLAASDDPSLDQFTREQIERFEKISELITGSFSYKIDRHILNSAGIERFPEKQFEMVRLGIGLYGVSCAQLPLQTISSFLSTVSQVKKVKEGETVGYNRNGKITGEREIAIVPVGYADGLDRRLGNGAGEAFIKGCRVPVAGNICMDMLMLDVTGLNVVPGDRVEFFGRNISVSEVAKKAGTIPYEIFTGISQRVKRVYLYE